MAILYSFRRCPYAMRARMAIAISGVQVELREVVLKDKPQALLDSSPKATVPILVLENNKVIDESLDIMQWALQQSDPEHWLANVDLELITNNDGTFKYWLDRYKYADRYPEESQLYYRQQAEITLSRLEQRLTQHDYLSCENISFTDIALFPFIRQFAFVDVDWFEQSPYPNLKNWLNTFIASPLFISIMKKYPQWQNEDTPIYFP
ncbi:MAG: glutathione S-transferase [Gammaproteobacteria bacterium]|nr:glutathione S-transferase [Gammaproteobacteria bacterium]